MKTLFHLFVFLVLCASTVYAQNPDTLTRVVDYDVFPIGAIRYPPADTLEKMFGMNCNWMGFPPPSTNVAFPLQERFINYTGSSVNDPFYYNSATSDSTTDHQFVLISAAYAIDVRAFLPNTSGKTEEYINGWNTRLGRNPTTDADKNNWIISDTLSTYGGYVLRDLSDGALVEPYTGVGIHQPELSGAETLNPNHIGTYSYELVFFFDQTALNSVGDFDSLYSIEYWIRKQSDDTGFVKIDSVLITKDMYSGLPLAVTQVGSRKVGAEKLDEWDGQHDRHYVIHKKILNVRDYFEGSNLEKAPKVDVRIKTYKKIPIYVRMLRIRDIVAQRLFTGIADNTLNTVIDRLKSHSINNSIKSWTVGNEPPAKNFHGYGYVNDLLVKRDAPPLNVLAPYHYDLFARVVRDQSENIKGNAKPILLNEWTIFTGTAWRSFGVDTSLTPHKVYRYWNYLDYSPHPPTPLPGAFTNDSANLFKRAIFVLNDYDRYTKIWQDSILGWCSENTGGGRGQYQEQMQRARSCYELDPANQVPYNFMPQTLVKRLSIAKWEVDSLRLWKADSLFFYNRDILNQNPTDALTNANEDAFDWAKNHYHTLIDDYLTRDGDNSVVEDSLFELFYEDRNPTAAEMDYQLWSGISSGIKSYILNVGYSDGLDQQGFLSDTAIVVGTDTTIIPIKSHNRNDFGITQDYIRNPYDKDDIFGSEKQYRRSYSLLPGYRELFNNVRSIIVDQIAPNAKTLSKLLWDGAVSWHKRDSTPTYLTRLRVKDVTSKAPTGSLDSSDKTYVQFGIHKHPTDTVATYITVQNRRLWCNVANTDTTDTRIVTFKVDADKFVDFEDVNLFSITNLTTSEETILHKDSIFSIRLKPGQGRLLRIAPAMGLALGEASDNLFNNGRHIAAIETSSGDVTQYVTTYQRNGNIVISFPVETPSGESKREAGTPIDTIIDNSGKCFNPAVAYKQDRDLIGITYRKVLAGNGPTVNDTILILYRTANYTLPRVYSAPVKVDSFIAPKGYLSPPAIAPKVGIDGNNFWIGYNHPDSGGVLVLMDIPKTVPPPLKRYFWGNVRAHVKFVSIATHLPMDTCHVAFEEAATENDGSIFYTKGYISPITGNIHNIETSNISWANDICINHNPQIAYSGYVRVTWEGIRKRCVEEACVNSTYDHFAITRMRLGRNTWDAFDVFHTLEHVEQLSSEPYTPRIFPNIVLGGWSVTVDKHHPEIWKDFVRLSWSNSITGNIDIVREGWNGYFDYAHWAHYSYVEESQQPAMPTLSRGLNALHPFTYLHPLESSALDQLRIVRYEFPKNNIVQEPSNWEKIIANPFAFQACNRQIKQTWGDIKVKNVVDIESPIAFAISSDSLRTDFDYAPISWNDKRLRTVNFPIVANDTLLYQRFFQVGDFQAGDTTAVSDSLRNIFDFITGRIYLRQASNDSVLAILDTCKLTKFGFVQSANGGSLKSYPLPMSSDSVYMSMEMIRGNDTNGFTISVAHVRGEDLYTGYIPTAGAFKKADPTALPSTGAVQSTPLTLSVTPNPFESSTRLIVQTVKDIPLTVEVYNVLGGLVAGLYNGMSLLEHYEFTLDSRVIRPGTYFVRAKAGNSIITRKIQFVK